MLLRLLKSKSLKNFYVPLLYLSFVSTICAQNNGVKNIATPNAAAFEKYSLHSVNSYNGKTDINIPIYNIQAGNINFPLNLNYAIGGIQVNTIASDVGLGWSLNEPVITRNIIEEMDLTENYSGMNGINSIDPPSNCGCTNDYSFDSPPPFNISGYNSDSNFHHNDLSAGGDLYPDLFNVYLPSSSAQFFFEDKNTVYDLSNQSLKINWETDWKKYSSVAKINGCNHDYSKFVITTKNGISYYFDVRDVIQNLSLRDQSSQGFYLYDTFYNTPALVVAWHLSKIVDNITGKQIDLIYEQYNPDNDNRLSIHPVAGPIINNSEYLNQYSAEWADDSYFWPGGYETFNLTRNLVLNRIKTINFPNGSITFSYDKNREDFKLGKAVTAINVNDYKGNAIKTYNLDYSYFYSDNQDNGLTNNTEFSKRLKLNSVTESGKPPYHFLYFEDNNLPQIGSLFRDIFGYSNQKDKLLSTFNFYLPQGSTPIYSKLYYYPNQYEYSILPFDIGGKAHFDLGGTLDRTSNDLSKTWSLRKIIYPTGGSSEFDLESNDFSLWNTTIKGGGVRIRSQILKENESAAPRTIYYNYIDDKGLSTGYLFNAPYCGSPSTIINYNNTLTDKNGIPIDLSKIRKYFTIDVAPAINYDITNKFFLGYSKVTETENNIKKIIEFYNNEYSNIPTRGVIPITSNNINNDYTKNSDFIIKNSGYGNEKYIDRSFLRGHPKNIYYYDDQNKLLKQEYYSYQEVKNPNLPIITHQSYLWMIIPTLQYCECGGANDYRYLPTGAIISGVKKDYYSRNNLLASKTTTNYLPSGNKKEQTSYYYDNSNSNLREQKQSIYGTQTSASFYQYPTDLINNNQYPYMQDLVNKNMTGTPIVISHYVGNDADVQNQNISTLVSTKVSNFASYNTSLSPAASMILPKNTIGYIGNTGIPNQEVSYDIYDNKGNLIQYTSKNSVPVTILWGYQQSLPIVKIEGATYAQVMQTLGLNVNDPNAYLSSDIVNKSNIDTDVNSENILRQSLNTFRITTGLKNYLVTTYTFDPMIGVTSITPSNGITEFYNYDIEHRLQSVVDVNGNILKENKYNYKQSQIFFNSEKKQIFYKNNCPSGCTPSPYTYHVGAHKYISTVSQQDADQQAQNEINSKGQNAANDYTACNNVRCPISILDDIDMNTSTAVGYLDSASSVQCTLSFYSDNASRLMSKLISGAIIGNISNVGRPSQNRTISSVNIGYNVLADFIIYTNGDIYMKITRLGIDSNKNYSVNFTYPK